MIKSVVMVCSLETGDALCKNVRIDTHRYALTQKETLLRIRQAMK